jgi:F-type H+-transporting ATPase subunit epsilon
MLFKTEIISPEGFLVNQDVYMVVLPTKSGEIGIMANHEEVITELKSGSIKIYSNSSSIDHEIKVNFGFAKVINSVLTVTISK